VLRGLKLTAQGIAVAAVAALLVLLIWKIVEDDGGAASAVKRGEHPVAPGFTLPRLDRAGELSLTSLRGKAVVLNFWASWCGPCKKEAPLLEAAWRAWRDRGVVVVGVDAKDFTDDAQRFMRKYGVTYPNVRDGSGDLEEPYGLLAYPETFFVDRRGRIVEHIVGQIHEGSQIDAGIRVALER
jgi:cytochrome c biogenesis protein CcmG/thiol:disulfide interchange protein DsbE